MMLTRKTSGRFIAGHRLALLFCLTLILEQAFAGLRKTSNQEKIIEERESSAVFPAIERPEQRRRRLQELQGYGGDPDPSRFPLQVCEGDCDNDSDCDNDLICFQRDENMAVPGCDGGESFPSKSDFCIQDPNSSSEIPSTAPTVSTPQPSVSAQPSLSANPSTLPSVSVTPSISLTPTSPPVTLEPTPYVPKLVEIVGDDGAPASVFPLGLCQGDCDDDNDCDWGLGCVQRSNRNDQVPGCATDESTPSDRDFCAPLTPDQWPVVPGAFRLKLYWEEGYTWQDESIERKWCATFDYDGGECWYGDDSKRCSDDEMYISTCSSDPRQAFVFVQLSDDEVVVKLGKNGDDRCWERLGRAVYLRPCDITNPLQVWFAPNGSFADGDKFEMSQKNFESQCVSNDHHPKKGEVVELHSCAALRKPDSQSSFWNKY